MEARNSLEAAVRSVERTPVLIAIGGRSGSGKTTLAHFLGRRLDGELSTESAHNAASVRPESASPVIGRSRAGRCALIALDWYYRDRSDLPAAVRESLNFDAPEAIEHELLLQHLQSLSRGESIERPVYDFTTHTRRAQSVIVQPQPYIVLEGLLALHWPEIRGLCALTVYVDLEPGECFRRRLERDTCERGRTAASVERQCRETVWPMAERYVIPAKRWADVVVSGAEDVAVGAQAVMKRLGLGG